MEQRDLDKKYSRKYRIRKIIIFGIFMLIILFSLLAFLYLKADEITKHPCQVCAKQMGENIICTMVATIDYPTATRTFYPNGTIIDKIGS